MTAREAGCLKCGRIGGATLLVDGRRGGQLRCPCGHVWRPRKPVQRPRGTEAAA